MKPGSRFVKRNGVWLNKFKFLGLVYDPFTDTLSASTRKGSTLSLSANAESEREISELISEYDARFGLYHPTNSKSWEMLIKSNLGG
jgi:hypothetical protein